LKFRNTVANFQVWSTGIPYLAKVNKGLSRNPVVSLTGPRQCGKTTLARQYIQEAGGTFFDLEDPAVLEALQEPMSTLSGLEGLVVLDEAQRLPSLFPVLRVLCDRNLGKNGQFLLLGSASPELSRQVSESLAGRVELLEMHGFHHGELGGSNHQKLWIRGGFPRSYLAANEEDSLAWRKNFISTFLERDLAALGFGMSPQSMGRFWRMLAHYHGQIWNGSEIAGSMGIAPNTAKAYLDALEQTYMVRRILPWFENVGKRLVKSPKIYFRDSGTFHSLLGIHSHQDLLTHPKLGASWEGFVLEGLLTLRDIQEPYFYSVHSGSELDLFYFSGGKRIGVEIKRTDAPKLTKSMQVCLQDLHLDALHVIYPGELEYALAEKVRAIPFGKAIATGDW
jgi:predicted AAA+ superfamily ATPase